MRGAGSVEEGREEKMMLDRRNEAESSFIALFAWLVVRL
jgi:hypothetical protein